MISSDALDPLECEVLALLCRQQSNGSLSSTKGPSSNILDKEIEDVVQQNLGGANSSSQESTHQTNGAYSDSADSDSGGTSENKDAESKPGTGSKRFCEICDKEFTRTETYRRHLRVHTGERPYSCDSCELAFARKEHLANHTRSTHTGEKPFPCSICSKEFSTSSAQRRHIMSHAKPKKKTGPFFCTICGLKYKIQCRLKSHMRVHTGERSYKCGQCFKEFTGKRQLILHQESQSCFEEKSFSCELCGRCFFSEEYLKRHKERLVCSSKEALPQIPSIVAVGTKGSNQKPTPFRLEPDISSDISRNSTSSHPMETPSISDSTDDPYTCKHCGIRFLFKWLLMNHLRTVLPDEYGEMQVGSVEERMKITAQTSMADIEMELNLSKRNFLNRKNVVPDPTVALPQNSHTDVLIEPCFVGIDIKTELVQQEEFLDPDVVAIVKAEVEEQEYVMTGVLEAELDQMSTGEASKTRVVERVLSVNDKLHGQHSSSIEIDNHNSSHMERNDALNIVSDLFGGEKALPNIDEQEFGSTSYVVTSSRETVVRDLVNVVVRPVIQHQKRPVCESELTSSSHLEFQSAARTALGGWNQLSSPSREAVRTRTGMIRTYPGRRPGPVKPASDDMESEAFPSRSVRDDSSDKPSKAIRVQHLTQRNQSASEEAMPVGALHLNKVTADPTRPVGALSWNEITAGPTRKDNKSAKLQTVGASLQSGASRPNRHILEDTVPLTEPPNRVMAKKSDVFPCPVCEEEFISQVSLAAHMKYHTGERPFECPECKKFYCSKSKMNEHIKRAHKGDNRYTCRICQMKFKYSHILTTHLETHRAGKVFKCKVCAKRFVWKKDLLSHQIKVHYPEFDTEV